MNRLYMPSELRVHITNLTHTCFNLNTEFTPLGVVLRQGTTYIDGDKFWLVQHFPGTSKVTVLPSRGVYGNMVNRNAANNRLAQIGDAVGMTDIRVTSLNGVADIEIRIEEA